jgi:hypothetical protein
MRWLAYRAAVAGDNTRGTVKSEQFDLQTRLVSGSGTDGFMELSSSVEMLLMDRSVRSARQIHDDAPAVGWTLEEFGYAAAHRLIMPGAADSDWAYLRDRDTTPLEQAGFRRSSR